MAENTKHLIEVKVTGEYNVAQNPVENITDSNTPVALNPSSILPKGVATAVALKAGREALKWAEFPFANAGALTGDYVMQNDYNNLRKAIALPGMIMSNPTGFIQSEILRKNEIYKANLKVQELREITNTTAESIFRKYGRGI